MSRGQQQSDPPTAALQLSFWVPIFLGNAWLRQGSRCATELDAQIVKVQKKVAPPTNHVVEIG
jgi:hypothetical protein